MRGCHLHLTMKMKTIYDNKGVVYFFGTFRDMDDARHQTEGIHRKLQ